MQMILYTFILNVIQKFLTVKLQLFSMPFKNANYSLVYCNNLLESFLHEEAI